MHYTLAVGYNLMFSCNQVNVITTVILHVNTAKFITVERYSNTLNGNQAYLKSLQFISKSNDYMQSLHRNQYTELFYVMFTANQERNITKINSLVLKWDLSSFCEQFKL